MKRIALLTMLGALFVCTTPVFAEIISTLNKNDPAPLWSTYFPLDFLLAGRKAYYKGYACKHYPETFSLAITPFHQKANRGRNFDKERVPIGDIAGRWHMLGMLYGGIPQEVQALLGENIPSPLQLGNAKAAVFSDLQRPGMPLPPLGALPNTIISNTENQQFLLQDQCRRVGYFSAPIRYRKTGLRFEMQFSPIFDFGITVRTGVVEIKQTLTGFQDLIPTTTECCQVGICPPPNNPVFVNCCPVNVDERRIPQEFLREIPTVPALLPPGTTCQMLDTCTQRYVAVERELMDPCSADRIFRELCLDPCDFRDTSIEDVHVSVWFRHAFKINTNGYGNKLCSWSCDGTCVDDESNCPDCNSMSNCSNCNGKDMHGNCNNWYKDRSNSYRTKGECGDACLLDEYCYDYTCFLFIPFISFNASLPTAKEKDRTKLFSLPFGNDGHTGLGMDAGFDLDFYETVEFGIEAGFMRWSSKEFGEKQFITTGTVSNRNWFKGFRIPTHEKQSGIFPYATTVTRRPGTNFHFSAVLRAYRFLCNLSGFAQYVFVSHAEDELCINDVDNPGNIFKPEVLECLTKFEAQLFNTGLNYELSNNFSVGFAVQWPVAQRNAYRSTTYLGSLRLMF